MDINQISQIVSYLDAERRKDKAQLVQMVERVESLSREVEARTRYAQSLESGIGELKIQFARAMGWNTALDQLRTEFSATVEREQDQRTKSERELVRTRQIEIESIVRQLNEIKKEVKPYSKYAEDIQARQAEESRLGDLISRSQVQLMELERRLDQPAATLAYLEEQRRQDAKRVLQLEQLWPDIAKRIDVFPPRLALLEDAIRKKHTEIDEAARQLEAQRQVIENQRVADLRRERQFAEYAELIERLKVRADEIQAQVTGYYLMRDEVKRELSGLPDFKDQVEVRVNETSEIQRDAEERAKRAAAAFRDEIEKQWKTFAAAQEDKWHDRDRRIAEYDGRMTEIEDQLPGIALQIPPLYAVFEEFAKANIPSDVKPSRRQRRKQKALIEGEDAAQPGGEDLDADLVK